MASERPDAATDAAKVRGGDSTQKLAEGVCAAGSAATGRPVDERPVHPVTPDAGSAATSLRLVPLSLAQANEHVAAWHRHNKPVVQAIFRVGVADQDGVLRAVAIVERPKARGNADGETVEITRVASDGTVNACSMLYGACTRTAFALGYRRVITYLQGDEPGTSVKASGFRLIASRPARRGWNTPSRLRDNNEYRSPRQLREKVAP